jgi:hypothetical protein
MGPARTLLTAKMSAVDRLADALQRADSTWRGGEISRWDELTESEQEQWRAMARTAVRAVAEEDRHR